MSDALLVVLFRSTKIGEISDMAKCFGNFVSQTLGFSASFCTAELRDNGKCVHLKGMDSRICIDCERRGGRKSVSKCPFGVSVPVARDMEGSDVFGIIERDKDTFGEKGGVTFSGGEPLLQTFQLLPVLQSCKANNIHILFETTLFVRTEMLNAVLPYANEIIVDLKLQPEQGDISNYLKVLKTNLAAIERKNIAIHYRLVFVNSMSKIKNEVLGYLKALNVSAIELLKCHNLGLKKYEKLQLENHDFTADYDLCNLFADFLTDNGIDVSLLKI